MIGTDLDKQLYDAYGKKKPAVIQKAMLEKEDKPVENEASDNTGVRRKLLEINGNKEK